MDVKPGYKQTEVGLIPEDWEVKEIGDLEPFVTSGSRGWAAFYSERGSPFIRITNLSRTCIYPDLQDLRFVKLAANDSEAARTQLRDGDVLISITADIGLVGYVTTKLPKPAYINQHIALVRLDSTLTNSRFISYFLASANPQKLFRALTDSGAKAGMNLRTVQQIRIALPPTKAEQEAIAEALSDADSLIESLEQLLAKKRRLKQGAMQELLTGKKRLPGFEVKRGYKQSEMGLIPKDWELRPLLTAVRIAQGQVDPKIEPWKSMFLVGPVHVESGTGKLVTRQTAVEQGAISGKYLFAEGDIVYGKINPYLQKAFLTDFSGLCSADMYPLKPANDVSSGFMLAVILGHQFTKYAESVSVRSGMPKINRVEMGEFVFPIPSDRAEQSAIAAILSDMDAEIAALEAKVGKTRALKQGMMQELLTGSIRLV